MTIAVGTRRARGDLRGSTRRPRQLGFYLVADGSGVAYRARTRPPSYIHFAHFPY